MRYLDIIATEAAIKLPTIMLKRGTMLYHGTKSAGTFAVPDGPAWFAFNAAKASTWIDWSKSMPAGRTEGEKRILIVEVVRSVTLVDTSDADVWYRFCEQLTGDPEADISTVAQRAKEEGYAGWYGRTEVMLSDPAQHVRTFRGNRLRRT